MVKSVAKPIVTKIVADQVENSIEISELAARPEAETGRHIDGLGSVANADRETVTVYYNPDVLELIERLRVRQAPESGISSEEMRRRLDIPQTRPVP